MADYTKALKMLDIVKDNIASIEYETVKGSKGEYVSEEYLTDKIMLAEYNLDKVKRALLVD
jgi:hypothetical protein